MRETNKNFQWLILNLGLLLFAVISPLTYSHWEWEWIVIIVLDGLMLLMIIAIIYIDVLKREKQRQYTVNALSRLQEKINGVVGGK